MGPKSNDECLYKREKEKSQRYTRRQCKNGGRDGSYAAPSQKTLRVVGSHKKLRKRHGTDCPSELLEGTNSANILILGLLISRRIQE